MEVSASHSTYSPLPLWQPKTRLKPSFFMPQKCISANPFNFIASSATTSPLKINYLGRRATLFLYFVDHISRVHCFHQTPPPPNPPILVGGGSKTCIDFPPRRGTYKEVIGGGGGDTLKSVDREIRFTIRRGGAGGENN